MQYFTQHPFQAAFVCFLILAFLGVIGHVIRCYYFDKPKKRFKIHKVEAEEEYHYNDVDFDCEQELF